jgi:hypothetical protein
LVIGTDVGDIRRLVAPGLMHVEIEPLVLMKIIGGRTDGMDHHQVFTTMSTSI